MTEPLLLTTDQAAELLQCSARQVQYLVADQGLPFVRLGTRQRRYLRAEIERWVADRVELAS